MGKSSRIIELEMKDKDQKKIISKWRKTFGSKIPKYTEKSRRK